MKNVEGGGKLPLPYISLSRQKESELPCFAKDKHCRTVADNVTKKQRKKCTFFSLRVPVPGYLYFSLKYRLEDTKTGGKIALLGVGR